MDNPLLVLAAHAACWRTRRWPVGVEHHARRALVDWFAALLPGTSRPPAALLAPALASERGTGRAICYVDGALSGMRRKRRWQVADVDAGEGKPHKRLHGLPRHGQPHGGVRRHPPRLRLPPGQPHHRRRARRRPGDPVFARCRHGRPAARHRRGLRGLLPHRPRGAAQPLSVLAHHRNGRHVRRRHRRRVAARLRGHADRARDRHRRDHGRRPAAGLSRRRHEQAAASRPRRRCRHAGRARRRCRGDRRAGCAARPGRLRRRHQRGRRQMGQGARRAGRKFRDRHDDV